MSDATRARLPWGWIGFFGILVLLALLSVAALLKGGRDLAETRTPVEREPVWRVIVHGDVHLLDEAAFRRFQAQLHRSVDRRFSKLHGEADQLVEKQVAEVFAPVYAAIPAYADWYYSLTGEYLRYAHALGSGIAGYMEQKLKEILFDETGMEQALAELPARIQSQMLEKVRQAGQGIIAELEAELKREDGQAEQALHWEVADEIPLDALIDEELISPGKLATRQIFSLGAGAGAGFLVAKGGGALLVKKMVATAASGKSFQLAAGVAGKLAAKSAAKGGSVLAGAGTGALVCAPGGPLALVCGAAAGILTWLTVDLVMLEVDEHFNREELEEEIRHAIRNEELALEESLKRLYASWLNERLERFRQRTFASDEKRSGYRPIDQFGVSGGEEPGEAAESPAEPSSPQ